MARGQTVEMIADNEPETPIERDIASVGDRILSEFDAGNDAVSWDIRIYQLDKSAGNAEGYLFSVLPDELDGLLDRVRDEKGTGTYRMRAYKKEGKQKSVFAQTDFRVIAPVRPVTPPQQQTEMAAILAAINASNERTQQLLERLLINPPQALIPQVPATPQSPYSAMKEMLEAMAQLRGAFMPQEGTSATDLIIKGVELANKLRGENSDTEREPGMMDIIKEFIRSPLLARMAETQPALAGVPAVIPQPASAVPASVPNPQPQPAPANTTKASEQHSEKPASQGEAASFDWNNPQHLAKLRGDILYLNEKAKKASPPELYADWLMDNWPHDLIYAIAMSANTMPTLGRLVPETTPYAGWFQKLIAELQNLVNDAGEGNAADVSSPASPVQPVGNSGRGGGGADDFEGDE